MSYVRAMPVLRSGVRRYGFAIACAAIALAGALVLSAFRLEKFLLLTAVAVTAWYAGQGPAILIVALSTIALQFFFLTPAYSLAIDPEHLPYLVVFLLFASVIAWLARSFRRAQESLVHARDDLQMKVQERTTELEQFNKQLRDEIAERKRAEDELRQQAALLTLAHDAILVRDLDSRVLYWNPGAQDTYGWTAAEAIGCVTHELLQTTFPVSRMATDEALQAEGMWSGELTHITRNGAAIVVASRQSLLRDERGGPSAILEINRDVTDRKHAEEALRETEAQLAHVARVTTLGEVTASVAHELNQPLAAIANNAIACLELLSGDDESAKEVREALHDIVGDAQRASAVIERVRSMAKRAPPEKVALRLADVVNEVVVVAGRELAARSVRIHTDVATDLPIVLGDRVQLQQVLLNLIVNGMDAMASLSGRERRLEIRGRTEQRDGTPMVTISVHDRGIGLAAGQANSIFEAFYTTKRQGMGLGLAISRSIVEAHGGRLWAEANEGPGATFAFSLPAAAAFQAA